MKIIFTLISIWQKGYFSLASRSWSNTNTICKKNNSHAHEIVILIYYVELPRLSRCWKIYAQIKEQKDLCNKNDMGAQFSFKKCNIFLLQVTTAYIIPITTSFTSYDFQTRIWHIQSIFCLSCSRAQNCFLEDRVLNIYCLSTN